MNEIDIFPSFALINVIYINWLLSLIESDSNWANTENAVSSERAKRASIIDCGTRARAISRGLELISIEDIYIFLSK